MRANKLGVNKFDITLFNAVEIKNVSLGQFNKEIVDFIISKKPDFIGRLEANKDILFWKARVKHTNNHKKDFVTEEEFNKCVEEIPYIIQNPDYISIHPTDESVSFIKQYTEKVSVAIKISIDGKLVFRTMYPLDERQLSDYIEKGRAWKYSKVD
jgi:hypothetical protein